MAYDPYGNYQAPARPYYNRPNQRPGPPQPRGYERQYGSQGQDQELYDQGGYDGYNDGYADQGQWDQQQYGNQNAGYDNYGYEQQPPSRQRGPPQQQMGYGQPSTQDHPPQQRQQRNRGYMGPPIQANAPPPDRQNLGFQQPQQQRPTPRQNQYQRSQGSQDDYDPYGQPMSPVSPRGINNAPWSGHDPSEGRSSPFEPVGGRPGSRPQNKRLEDQRRQFMDEARRDSDLALPMDNPFPTFPIKKAVTKQRGKGSQDGSIEEGMAKLSFDGGRPSLDSHRGNSSGTVATTRSAPAQAGPRGVPRFDDGGAQRWQRNQQSPPRQQQMNHGPPGPAFGPPEGYHAPQQLASWPLVDDLPPPPRQEFQLPPRPSTATGMRSSPGAGPGGRRPPGGANGHNPQGPPGRPRRRSSFGGHERPNMGGGSGYNRSYEQEQQRPQPNQYKQYGAAYAQTGQTNGYNEYSSNPYANEGGDMPNFDAQGPSGLQHEHSINMHLDGGPVRQQPPVRQSPQQSGPQNGYSTNDNGYGYGQSPPQMYNQGPKAQSQPDLTREDPGYGYQNGPVPNRGPGGRGLPPGPGPGPARPGASPLSRLQTGASQWSDPGPGAGSRGESPLSAGGSRATPPSRARTNPTPPGQQRPDNPDALPHHPVPVRPGLLEGTQASKPPPVRMYQTPNASNSASPRPSIDVARPAETTPAGPVTVDEIERLRASLRMNPGDHATSLTLAKRLVDASTVLTQAIPDQRQRQKQREKYIFDAHKVVKKLVSQNYPEAMFYLADCHGQGLLGLSPDPKEAFQLYQTAAKLGHPPSAYRTAVCCEMGADDGGGTRKDPLKAVQWYRRAASLGEPAGMYKLGMILLKGLLGQQRNSGEAVNWLQRAADKADKDNPHALHELGLLYASPPTDGRIIRDDKYASQLFEKAARIGYKFSQFKLGEAFEYGLLGLPIDQRSSIAWYSKAAGQEEHQSELALSGWYLTGAPGILEQSDTEAYLWARKAAQAELPKGMFAMGYFTEVGIGCPRSLEEAKRWYGRAAALRYPKAQERLEELKKGGVKAQKNRERLSRSDRRQHDENCVVM